MMHQIAMKQKISILIALFVLSFPLKAQQIKLNTNVKDCYALFDNNKLVVGNSKMERTWHWTGKGLLTSSLLNKISGKEWCNLNPTIGSDWQLPSVLELPEAKILKLEAKESNDEKFAASHLQVVAEVEYPSLKTTVKYEVWIFPATSGVRTQLFVKSKQTFAVTNEITGIPFSEMSIVKASESDSLADAANHVIDNNLKTFYRTKAVKNLNTPFNYVVLDLGKDRNIETVGLNQLQDYRVLGYVNKCAIYASNNPEKWDTTPIVVADLNRSHYLQYFICKPTKARYIRLTALPTSAVNLYDYKTSIAEIRVFDNEHPVQKTEELVVEHFPVNANGFVRRGMGYYADTQWRNSLEYPFLREESKQSSFKTELWDWNNILSIEDKNEGFCLIKESHKTVLQKGHYTGGFVCDANGISTTGWGIAPNEITDEYKKCWANWTVLYQGQDDERQLAIKTFDRKRFPNTLPGHYQIYACSWGNSDHPKRGAKDGALESNVLAELDAAKSAGIETYLIDDGWQVHPDTMAWKPEKGIWHPHAVTYPNGWKTVLDKAKENKMQLALWASVDIPAVDLKYNQDLANFAGWKWDFAYINSYSELAKIEGKARNFIKSYNHQLSIQWDLTENTPRYGFYWGREYGVVWLANKEKVHVRYNPPHVLRDVWELSKYVNTDKFQLPIRNINDFDKAGNGTLYNVEYCNAITFMGNPMFFEKVGSYNPESMARIKKNLEMYKNERGQLKNSFVFPIGEQPNNESYSGFQAVNEDGKTGHLLVFRELYATEPSHEIKLRFLKNVTLELENLKTGTLQQLQVNENGIAVFAIANAADFEYYRYKIVK
jgi:hypothetical protein